MKLKWWHIGLALAFFLAVLSPLASTAPTGLDRVTEEKGLVEAQGAPFQVIADYVFPGIQNEALATILAGLIGTLILFGVVYGLAWLIRSRKKELAE